MNLARSYCIVSHCRMKAFVLIVCLFAAVQANVEQRISVGAATAVAGDSPSIVHIRTTQFDTGYLKTCAGSLIDQAWIITTVTCLDNVRFTWLRFGALNVQNPDLVIEHGSSSTNRFNHPQYNAATGANNVALLFIPRLIPRSNYIDYATLSTSAPGLSGRFCSYGAVNRVVGALMQLTPGQDLHCADVALEQQGDLLVATSDEGFATRFDDGAPLLGAGGQIGVLVSWPAAATGNTVGVFLRPSNYLEWIREVTGLPLSGGQVSVIG